MAEYDRSSRSIAVHELHPALLETAQRVANDQGVGDLAAAARMCVETHSRRTRGDGIFARLMGIADTDVEHWTAVIHTRDGLLIGVSGAKRGTNVFFVPYVTLELDDMRSRGPSGSSALGFKSPTFARGPGGGGIGEYSVWFGSPEARDGVRDAVLAALAERRSG